MVYLHFVSANHNFSTTKFNLFNNLENARCGVLTQFYKSEIISKLQFVIF